MNFLMNGWNITDELIFVSFIYFSVSVISFFFFYESVILCLLFCFIRNIH